MRPEDPGNTIKMRITRHQLRRIILETLVLERKALATVSDVTRFKPQVEDWVEVLVDELSTASERWEDVNEKRLKNMVRSITDAVISALISATSGISSSSQRTYEKRQEEKGHEKWDKERKSRSSSGVSYYGGYAP